MVRFVASLRGINRVHLLPFHAIAGDKYRRLRMKNRMEGTKSPSSDRIDSIKAQFESQGLEVSIGG
jgi:pyruvate formate lyase activating enzyme